MKPLRWLALLAIGAYQRFLSPYKGFACAYRVHTGRASCSELGRRAIRRHGLWGGLQLLQRRTALCGEAHRCHATPHATTPPLHRHAQRGLCDLSCDLPCDSPCDLPSGRGLGSAVCDALSCCDCGSCDRKRREPRQRRGERYVHIPPNGLRRDEAKPRTAPEAQD